LKENYANQHFCLELDSHYDSKEVFDLFENERDIYFCIGLVASRHKEIHEMLQLNLGWGEWNACKSDKSVLYSVKIERELDNSKTVHFCSTDFLKEALNTTSSTDSSDNVTNSGSASSNVPF
jgi:hypothetical protein